jgi:putative isomerase
MSSFPSQYLELLKDKINLHDIPFTERGSRLMVLRDERGFFIRLCERWIKRDQKLSAYRARPPILDELTICSPDGTPLPIELTTYPHQLELNTPLGQFILAFQDTETLIFILPPGEFALSFLAHVDNALTDWRGGVMRTTGNIRRSIAYTTNASLLENEVTVQGDDLLRVRLRISSQPAGDPPHALLINITPRLGFNRYVPDPSPVLRATAQRWHDWFASAPPVAEAHRRQYYFAWWIMRSGLVSTRYYLTREALMPSKLHYVGVWQWDAYFHALAYRYVDMHLAQDQIRLQLDHQTPDGQIPDAIHDEGIVIHLDFPIDADVTKPPLIAWTAWKLYEHQPDPEFLREIYEPVARWNRWWYEHNDRDQNGLCDYQHPFSSGLDDSPLWDAGMPVESPDLNTYLYLQQAALARIAHLIGDDRAASTWSERANEVLDRMIEYSWDAQAGLFWARHAGQPIRIRTPFSLFPLLTGRLPQAISDRLVAHLTDPLQFWPRYPVPTVALNDPNYAPLQMWRGPTWTNTNYLLILGLESSGYKQAAHELRKKTLELLMQQDNIFEYYHPETGEAPPKAAPIFGWSAATFIELAIQDYQELGEEGK